MSRIYEVNESGSAPDQLPELVLANSRAQAIAHVVGARFTGSVPTGARVAYLMQAGVKPQNANAAAQAELDEGDAP